jgi:hypothetical protein
LKIDFAGLAKASYPLLPALYRVDLLADATLTRFDALHLLDSLPDFPTAPDSPATSTGWLDLPSDAEDMFFFSESERENIAWEKRRKQFELNREERLRALRAEEGGQENERDDWGGSDEEVLALFPGFRAAWLKLPNDSLTKFKPASWNGQRGTSCLRLTLGNLR